MKKKLALSASVMIAIIESYTSLLLLDLDIISLAIGTGFNLQVFKNSLT